MFCNYKKMEQTNPIEIYYNPKQIAFIEMAPSVVLEDMSFIKVFKGGRGSGKTRCIPEDILDRAANLPKARIFLLSYTFDMIYDNIMPDIHEVFRLHGLKEGHDYVVDRKPPPHFELPYKRLEDYDHSISLFNGFAVQMLSTARKAERNRGGSYDGGIVDEALLITQYQFDSIFYPTIRGLDHWDANPYWKMVSIYSSHPRDVEGGWFLRYKELAEKYPNQYGWVEATAFDNLHVVGKNYVYNQQKVLNYVDFQIEIMNQGEIKNLPDRFYYQFSEEKHCYKAQKHSDDINTFEALDLSFDFGGHYSCVTVSQQQNNTEYYIKEFDTNNVTEQQRQQGVIKKLPNIVTDFIEYFSNHHHKQARIWGDRIGLNKNPTDDKNYFEQIQDQLQRAGWTVELLVTYSDSALHKSRWTFLNTCFEETIIDYPRIRINSLRCPNLVTSLNQTKITDDFKKNKKQETNPHFNQSHAPHLTDTFDYKVFNKYFYLLDESWYGGAVDTNIDSI